MAKTVTISSKGQITLPKALRDKHNLREGDLAVVVDAGEGILIRPKSSLRGLLKGKIDEQGFEKDLRAVRRKWTL